MRRSACWIGTIALLTGCGGGGNSGGGEDAGTATASGIATIAAASVSTCGLPDFAASAMARINRYRAAGASCGAQGRFAPTAALGWHDALDQAASGHTVDMAARNYFSHTGQDGSTAAQRVDAAGYAWRTVGENIAAGQATVEAVVDGWMASDGHCANLMNPAFVHMGLACANGSGSTTYSRYWTLDLAAPR